MKYFNALKGSLINLFSSKREQNKLVLLKCQNCETKMYGRFCHICGQSLFAGRKGASENILYNFLNPYAVDFRIFNTILSLLFYPGKLTKEFCQGHIIRYEHPFRLFWFVVIVFFVYVTYKFPPDTNTLS